MTDRPAGAPERRDPRKRADDKRLFSLVKVGAAVGIVLILAVGVIGIVAGRAADAANDAADKATTAANKATAAVKTARENAATLADLCAVARGQRRTLELSHENSVRYLKSPAGHEENGLNDFIRAISLPQLEARLKAERLPPSCHRRVRPGA